MKKNKKSWQKILGIIRDPVWNFTSCIVTAIFGILGIIGIVGVSGLIAFFTGNLKNILSWLLTPILTLRIYVVFVGVLVFVIFLPIAIRLLSNLNLPHKKVGTIPKNYYSFWNVLWKASSSMWGTGAFIVGPYCPKDQLTLEISFHDKEKRFYFYCQGLPEFGPHLITGPLFAELINPKGHRFDTNEDLIKNDIRERVEALWRKEGKL